MKKVLILAYDFPPYISVGGLRPFSWYESFHKFDIYPVVVTRQWSNSFGNKNDYVKAGISDQVILNIEKKGTIICAPYTPNLGNKIQLKFGENRFVLVRKFFTALHEFSQFIFFTGNKKPIYYAAADYLKFNKVDIIIATADPYILFKYADRLSHKFNIPWVADYRDPWSRTDFHKKIFLQRWLETFFERKYNKSCCKIITVVDTIKELILEKNKDKFIVINNGFNENIIDKINHIPQNNSEFSIALAGTIYKHHPIYSFLRVVHQFITKNSYVKIKIHFYGINIQPEIEKVVSEEIPELEKHIIFHAQISNDILLSELKKKNVFLLFNAYAATGTKIFEYIALKRKILLCYSNDSEANKLYEKYCRIKFKNKSDNNDLQADIIRNTNSGIIVKDSTHLAKILKDLYSEFELNGFIRCESVGVEQYSRLLQTSKLAELVKSIIENKQFYNIEPIYKISGCIKKSLILAYDFPPYISVGGLRPFSWYKYLHEFGLYPIVVTRQWKHTHGNQIDYISSSDSFQTTIEKSEHGTLICAPYSPNISNKLLLLYGNTKFKLIRKLFSAYYEIGQFMFLIGAKAQIYFAANNFLKSNKVDAIIATGDPFVLFKYASLLSKKYNIPWIADYRDPWTNDIAMQNNKILKFLNSIIEKKVVANSYQILTVSPFFKKLILVTNSNKPISIVSNGYDPEAVEKSCEINQQNKILSISFAGTIYIWHPLESFLKVCCCFIMQMSNPKLQINFYGVNESEKITKLINLKYPSLIPFVYVHPKISNELLMKKLSLDNVFLLFNDYHIIGTKIYDYIALKRQIIFCYSDDVESKILYNKFYKLKVDICDNSHIQEDFIIETNSGIIIQNSNHLLKVLKGLYAEFQENQFIKCNSIKIERLSRKTQTSILADIVKSI